MNPTRRRALLGLLAAPVIIRAPGLLMPVRKVADFDLDGLTRREWRSSYVSGVDAGDRDYTIWAVVKADGTLGVMFSTP